MSGPVILECPALTPKKEFELPVVLAAPLFPPIKVFSMPDVLE